MTRPLLLLAGAAALVVTACGSETGTTAPSAAPSSAGPLTRPTVVPAAEGEVTTSRPVTVLDDGGGAEVCLGGVADSLPPQCGGPVLVGWDWAEHEDDFESGAGVRWGEFVVTGTFDGTDLTPTSVLPADEYHAEPVDYEALEDTMFDTPCPEPEGGWIVDPALASGQDLDAAFRAAARLGDYADSFVDESLNPRTPLDAGPEPAVTPDIVNVRVTGDPAVAEAAIRRVWGGGLCVRGKAAHTDAELQRINDQVGSALPGVLSYGVSAESVEVSVLYDDGSLQAWVDQEYGAGLVLVGSSLVDA